MFNFLRCIRSADEDADGKRSWSAARSCSTSCEEQPRLFTALCVFLSAPSFTPCRHVCASTKDPEEGSLNVNSA